MKKLIAPVLAALAIASAPTAHADVSDFLAAVRAIGFWGSDAALVHNAQWVCDQLTLNPGNGYSAHDAAEILYHQSAIDSEAQAEAFAGYSVAEFCPQYLPGGSLNPASSTAPAPVDPGFGPFKT